MTTKNDELLKLLKDDGDCPAELIDLLESSQSKWRRGVVKQFINDHLWKKGVDKEIHHIKKIVWAIFSVVAIGLVSQYFIQYILPIIGA